MSPQGRWGSSIPGQPAPCILALFPQQTCPLSVVRLNILVWREGRREPEVPTSQSVRPWGGEGGSWARPPPARRQRCPAPPPAAPAAQTSREDLGRSPGESAPLSRAGSAAFCSPLAGGWQASWTAFCSAPGRLSPSGGLSLSRLHLCPHLSVSGFGLSVSPAACGCLCVSCYLRMGFPLGGPLLFPPP